MTVTALARGAVLHTPDHATWDVAAKCLRPVPITFDGKGHYQQPSYGRHWGEFQPNRTLSMQVTCRQCEACLQARVLYWRHRAIEEFKAAESLGLRTWFGTLTFGPAERYAFQTRTRLRLDDAWGRGPDREGPRWFREQHRETGPMVTRYLRALRKGRKRQGDERLAFRYLLTVEPHKDWTPHYHVLVHEVHDLYPIRKERLQRFWDHGFSSWKLVHDANGASYAAKYLSKYSVARVRASEFYGATIEQRNTISDHRSF